jgi:hypothetical protein
VTAQADLAFSMVVKPCKLNEDGEGAVADEAPDWDPVREAFLRLFVSLLRSYKGFLVLPTKADPR